jgi:hypothetical protein
VWCRPARTGAGDGADRHLAIFEFDQDFRTRTRDGEIAIIEEIEIGEGLTRRSAR